MANIRIVIDPNIQHGKPVVQGTTVPVARIAGNLIDQETFYPIRKTA